MERCIVRYLRYVFMNDEGEMERSGVNDLLYVFMNARNDKCGRQREFVKESAICLYE